MTASPYRIPRTPLDAEPLDLTRRTAPEDLVQTGRRVFAEAFRAAGVELGRHDRRIADWLATYELSTVVTIASWIVRAHDAGRTARRRKGSA